MAETIASIFKKLRATRVAGKEPSNFLKDLEGFIEEEDLEDYLLVSNNKIRYLIVSVDRARA